MSGPPEGSPAKTQDIRAELERVLEARLSPSRHIATLTRRPSLFRTSFPIEELGVGLSDGTKVAILFKDLDRENLSDAASKAKPEFLFDARREIATYRDILSTSSLDTPEYYGSTVDSRQGRYWLFIENVQGPALWQIGDFGVWRDAARWLAALHMRFAERPDSLEDSTLLRYDEHLYRRWMERARSFVAGRHRRDRTRASLEWLADRYEGVIERLMSVPSTFIHGEFYPSNVIVSDEDAPRPRISPIDWELAAVGPGLIDVAALTSGKLAEEEKVAMVNAYWSERDAAEGTGSPRAGAERESALDCARLHLAVQWLGWAADWRPPRKQRQDWLGEALRLAERLEL